MSIADKLTAVAENLPKVYEAGQKSVAVTATAKGNPAMLEYVHPIEHEMKVRLSSRNWLDLGGEDAGDWWKNGREFKRGTYVVGISRTLIASTLVSAHFTDNGTVKVTSGVSYYGVGFPRKLLPNTQYTFSAQVIDPSIVTVAYALCDNDGNYTDNAGSWHDNKITFTTSETGNVMLILAPTEADTEVTFSNVLLELGYEVTEYTPYISDFSGYQVLQAEGDGGTYIAEADGTVPGVKSVSPTSLLYAATPNGSLTNSGVVVMAEYYLDAEKKLKDMGVTLMNLGGSL